MNTLLRFTFCAVLTVGLVAFNCTASAQWSDGFETYADGQVLDGLGGDDGGWGGWDNNPAFAGICTSAFANGGTQSIQIGNTAGGNCDAVHPFVGEWTSGVIEVTAWMYLPASSFTADTYFIVNNAYDGSGLGYSWTTQMHFQILDNMIVCEAEGGGGTAAIIFDQWVEIKITYDMDNDVQETYYNGVMISVGTVDAAGPGPYEIANIDLFTTGAVNYFDDLSVQEQTKGCTNPLGDVNLDGDVNLLDVNPFVALLTDGGFQCEADIDESGTVDLLDVTPFVELLTGG